MTEIIKSSQSSYQMRMNIPDNARKHISDRSGEVYKLYWIHLEDHTNFTSQGYVGITVTPVKSRIIQHLISTEKGVSYTLHNAIRKYNDNLVVDVLAIGTKDCIRDLEFKARPELNIGWNICVGGSDTTSELLKEQWQGQKGDAWREERQTRFDRHPHLYDALQEGNRNFLANGGKEHLRQTTTDSWKDADVVKRRMKGNKEAGQRKSRTYQEVGRWLSSKTKHNIWERAKEFYDIFCEDTSVGRNKFAEKTGCTVNEIDCMHRKYFKKGWNPYEDQRWLDFYENGVREQYGR